MSTDPRTANESSRRLGRSNEFNDEFILILTAVDAQEGKGGWTP